MPVSAPPPPSKPAAAPAAPPKASPSPPAPGAHTPPPEGERAQTDYMADEMADLDLLSKEGDAAAEGRQPRKPAPKPKEGEQPPNLEQDEAAKAAAKKKADDAAAAAAAATAAPSEPKGIAAVREAYKGLKKKETDEYVPTIQRLEARVKELESGSPPEIKTLQERLTAAEQRRDLLEREIAHVDYQKTAEYQEKYVKPYQQAFSKALFEITQLNRELPDGTTRKATEDDLLALANAGLDQLDELAEKWFPRSSARVIRHVERIKELSEAQYNALEEAKARTEKELKTRHETQSMKQAQTRQQWTQANEAIQTKWPAMFAPVEGDAEGNALLKKGEVLADRLFSPTTQADVDRLLAEGKTADAEEAKLRMAPKNGEEALKLHAVMRHYIRNHNRLALWHKRDQAKIKELETALAEFEEHSPNGGLAGRGADAGRGNEAGIDDYNTELEELARKGPP